MQSCLVTLKQLADAVMQKGFFQTIHILHFLGFTDTSLTPTAMKSMDLLYNWLSRAGCSPCEYRTSTCLESNQRLHSAADFCLSLSPTMSSSNLQTLGRGMLGERKDPKGRKFPLSYTKSTSESEASWADSMEQTRKMVTEDVDKRPAVLM